MADEPEKWPNDDLLAQAEIMASECERLMSDEADDPLRRVAVLLRELARRYKAAIDPERGRRERRSG